MNALAPTAAPLDASTLYFRDHRSDKVYSCQVERAGDGYVVNFAYGRRGGTMATGTKTPTPVSLDAARKAYDKLVKEKTSKGYVRDEGAEAFSGTEHAGMASGIVPMLLNPVADDDELQALLRDDTWVLLEKFDGERRLLDITTERVTGINKRGLTVALPAEVAAAVAALGGPGGTVIDGELIGARFVAFDLLKIDGRDLRAERFDARFERLRKLLGRNATLELAAVATGADAKRAALDGIRAANGEGVVFRYAPGVYAAGRPNSGGHARKHKFVESATVRVARANDDRRSVAIEVLDDVGAWIAIGNVTIPANHDVPQKGEVVEVAYLYAYPSTFALAQPVYLGPRTDQTVEDCVRTQLKLKRAA